MEIADFELERYFARWEFNVDHLLCASDPEPVPMRELLALADPETERLWADLGLGYTESSGHPLLRQEIASRYRTVDRDEVLVCSGAQEAIFVALGSMLGPGDHVVVVWPSYQSLHEVARASGAEVTLLPLEHERGWALDLDRLRAALRPATRAVVVNFPHSPTGALPPASTLEALVELVEQRGIWLVSDEVYRLLELDPAERWPASPASRRPGCLTPAPRPPAGPAAPPRSRRRRPSRRARRVATRTAAPGYPCARSNRPAHSAGTRGGCSGT
jgi:DNA-binding transcriptional MocR family regulator